MGAERSDRVENAELQPAAEGSGPLLERDYWAVIDGCTLTAHEVGSLLARRFADFAPPSLVRFQRAPDASAHGPDDASGGDAGGDPTEPGRELVVGDVMRVEIVGAGTFGVRVIHRDSNSLTVGTLRGHPEAGRITFGAYRHERGDVVFHIRSRARSGSGPGYLGFLFAGDPMQTNTWTDFVNRVAATAGRGVVGAVHAGKRRVAEEPGDEALDRPTFVAQGE